jgi:hypothetical protein
MKSQGSKHITVLNHLATEEHCKKSKEKGKKEWRKEGQNKTLLPWMDYYIHIGGRWQALPVLEIGPSTLG